MLQSRLTRDPRSRSAQSCAADLYFWMILNSLLAILLVLTTACACSEDPAGEALPAEATPARTVPELAPVEIVADLRGDHNRNGTVDLTDESEDLDEDIWDARHGAIFLANIDDDANRCTYDEALSDAALAACHDAADEVINGVDDLHDLARLKTVPWPAAPDDARGTLDVAETARDYIRLFKKEGDQFVPYAGASLTARELRDGVEFAIEGRDIARDPAVWDGFVDLRFEVTVLAPRPDDAERLDDAERSAQTATDQLRMRVAPALLSHHLQPAVTVYAAATGRPESEPFLTDLEAAVDAAGVENGLEMIRTPDQWTQDYLETGYMSMPAPNGEQQIINLFFRSANVDQPKSPDRPLRQAGRYVFVARGRDAAAIQQFDLAHHIETEGKMWSLDSLGNTEVVPPFEHGGRRYPLGRILRGSTPTLYPDPSFQRLLDAQAFQPTLNIDTSWLLIGHVDETLTFIKAPGRPRGWAVLVNDPALAVQMLTQASEAGHGDVAMFVGKARWAPEGEAAAEVTIAEILADPDVMGPTAEAAVEIASQLETLRDEVGITDADLVPVPFLHEKFVGLSIAYQPGTVNGIVLSDSAFAAPDPHGPLIDGADPFKTQLTEALAPFGVTVHFVEDWDLLHRQGGEVHCGSNALRAVPAEVRWWQEVPR